MVKHCTVVLCLACTGFVVVVCLFFFNVIAQLPFQATLIQICASSLLDYVTIWSKVGYS
jgi:hypothetical protein